MRKPIQLTIFPFIVFISSLIDSSHQDHYQNVGKVSSIKRKFLPDVHSYLNPTINHTKVNYNYNPNDSIDPSKRNYFPDSGWIVQEPRNVHQNPDLNFRPPYMINYNPLINRTIPVTKAVVRTSTGKVVPLTPAQHAKSHPHHHHDQNEGSFRTHQHEDDGHHGHDHNVQDRKVIRDKWPFTTKAPNKWIYYPTPTPRRPITTHSPYENQLPLDFNLPIDHRHEDELHDVQHHVVGKGGTASNKGTNNGVIQSRDRGSGFRSSLDPFNYDLNLDTLDTTGVIRETIGDIKGSRIPRTFTTFSSNSNSNPGSLTASKDVRFEKDIYERFQQICTEIRGFRCDSNDELAKSSSSPARLVLGSPSSLQLSSPPPSSFDVVPDPSTKKFDPDFL